MAYKNVNRQNLLAVRLLQLRRHFTNCKECRGARKALSFDALCDTAKPLLIEVAVKWDVNIAKRLEVAKSGEDYIYPCPDLGAHGPAYSLTAEPCIIGATQGRLL